MNVLASSPHGLAVPADLEICIPDTRCVLAEWMIICGWKLIAATTGLNDEVLQHILLFGPLMLCIAIVLQ